MFGLHGLYRESVIQVLVDFTPLARISERGISAHLGTLLTVSRHNHVQFSSEMKVTLALF